MVKIPQHKVAKKAMFYVSFYYILCKIRKKIFVTSVSLNLAKNPAN